MNMAALKKFDFAPERRHATLTPAKSVRLAREFQQMTQHELAKASGVPQPAIAGIESARISLGADRAEKLARALKVHPAVLMWPQWESEVPIADGRRTSAARKIKETRDPSGHKEFSLYWCTTVDGDEDRFVVARTASAARRFHENAEGYDRGDARAERVMALPPEVLTGSGWRDGPDGEVHAHAAWPSDSLLVVCGGEVARRPRGGLRDTMRVVCKDVRFGERVFRAGDVVTNLDRAHGVNEPRLSVFKGGKRPAAKGVARVTRGGTRPARRRGLR
jgi:transcriptional regulator with XRE-family HTH domain